MKLKTNKSAIKRFKITKTGKVLRRKARQNHFNAKDSGNSKRRKHRETLIPKDYREKELRRLMPYK